MRCTLAVFCRLRLLHNDNDTVYFGKTSLFYGLQAPIQALLVTLL
ncbi:hypothetical protein PSAR109036_11470 [Psychrobacter arenosus]